MPILIKDYEVTEQEDKLFISVELKNVQSSKTDIYSNSCFIKINFPPYFFELDLWGKIDSESSVASVGDGKVLFSLVKVDQGIWPSINYTDQDRLSRRLNAEQEALILQEKVFSFNQIKEDKLTAKREKERELVRKQIEVEQAKRKEIEDIKKQESEIAKKGLEEWVSKQETKRQDSGIFADEDSGDDSDIDMEAIRASVRAKMVKPQMAPPRSTQTVQIKVSFTSRGSIPTKTARETEDGIIGLIRKMDDKDKALKVITCTKGE